MKEKQKQYREDNKDKTKEYRKQYNEDNKEDIQGKKKQYYKDNKEIFTKYRELNKDKINEKTKCGCGCEVIKYKLKRHQTSKKHIDLMNNQSL
jgi:hypothetical protein